MIGDKKLDDIIRTAFEEDLDVWGDITSQALVPAHVPVKADIICKQNGIIAGIPVARRVFEIIAPSLKFTAYYEEGARITQNAKVITVSGNVIEILTAERTALNFLGHLSGIATLTNQFVQAVTGTKARILDTRKTHPGLRYLEKYAVTIGGGVNHRFGLYDMFLVKDNHITAAGNITNAVIQCRRYATEKRIVSKIEVETMSLQQVEEAIAAGVDRIMLDNMSIAEMRHAVALVAGRIELEASGNVNLNNVAKIAATGVDFISIGALTHSAPVLDFSMKTTAMTS